MVIDAETTGRDTPQARPRAIRRVSNQLTYKLCGQISIIHSLIKIPSHDYSISIYLALTLQTRKVHSYLHIATVCAAKFPMVPHPRPKQ